MEDFTEEDLSGVKEAYFNEKLAVFLGAGVSTNEGCCTWRELCEKLLQSEDIKFEDSNSSDYLKEVLLGETDNKKLITLIYQFAKKEESFHQKFKELLEFKKEKGKENSIYKNIFSLENTLFVSTNADTYIDHYFGQREGVFCKLENFKAEYLQEKQRGKSLYKIHDSITDKDSLVFRTDQYLKRYSELKFQEFLKKISLNYTILFVGYSLSEFELLQYFLNFGTIKPKHYALFGYKSFQNLQLKADIEYFKILNVNVLGYETDFNGYEKLNFKVEEIVKGLKEHKEKEKRRMIEGLINQNIQRVEFRERIKLAQETVEDLENFI